MLIEGESGVGKELIAQHLHRLSPRASKAFVDLNCAAVPATLLESELFGHERGAFTGAGNEKPGLVEVADGGTLFLDEVGEMAAGDPVEVPARPRQRDVLPRGRHPQAARRLPPGGAPRTATCGPRSQAGRFRKDLFYRIHGVRVVIPPLRERPEDIPLLVEHFARAAPRGQKRFSPAALAALAAYDWPGNVRELHFAVERAGLLAEGDVIDVGDLPPEILERSVQRPSTGLGGMGASTAGGTAAPPPPQPTAPPRVTAPPSDEEGDDDDDLAFSRGGPDAARVREALEKSRWRREQAAEILGVSPRTLYRWMKRLGL